MYTYSQLPNSRRGLNRLKWVEIAKIEFTPHLETELESKCICECISICI